jgi:hypothetical protein
VNKLEVVVGAERRNGRSRRHFASCGGRGRGAGGGHDGDLRKVEQSVGHTPRVLIQGRMKTNSYYNSPVILLGLIPCNPTRTPAL